MITIENIGSNIVIYGRTFDGTLYRKIDKDFKPYFYYEDFKGDFKSIDGINVSKKICNYPKEVPIERENYSKTFESDIVYTNRYIIDKIDKIEKEPIRICYFDIEVARTEKGYESPELANNPVQCIGMYDSFTKEYKQICVGVTHKTEKEMLNSLIEYIKTTDPDILIAWNGDAFDFPFIINRMKNLKLKYNSLARDEQKVYTTKYGAKIFGRVLFDIMRAYKKHFADGGRESWSLDYISKYELKKLGGKEKYKGDLDSLYKNDINKFLSYNKRDVELMVLLNENLHIIDFFDEMRRLCFCKFEDIFMNSKMADCLCLKYAKEHNYILPRCPIKIEKERIKGAFVHESEPKLHKNISVMDMKSLYPSIMIGFNISYETLLKNKEDNCINVDDVYFFKREKGIIPAIVKPMLDKRKEISNYIEILDNKGSQEYKSLYLTQWALKIIANSFYGVLLLETFRLYNRDAGQCVTYTAQKIIREVHRWFEEHDMDVIYGDTDSCFLSMKEKTINDMLKLHKEINEYFKTYFLKYGVEEQNNIFKLEFEKVFATVFFKRKADGTGVKKKYAGHEIWNKGKVVDEISITGFESRRSDSPSLGREILKTVLTMILYENPKEEIDEYVERMKNEILGGFHEPEVIAFPIGINKDLKSYGNQIHAKASRKANEKHNAQIKEGDKIKYIFVKNPEKVIAFKEYLYDGYTVDYNQILRRIIDMKIGPLYECLGWNFNYMIIQKTKKQKEVPFEKRFKQRGLWD